MERAPALNKALTWADTERSLAIVTPRIRREPTRSIAKGGGTSVRHLPPRGISISLDYDSYCPSKGASIKDLRYKRTFSPSPHVPFRRSTPKKDIHNFKNIQFVTNRC